MKWLRIQSAEEGGEWRDRQTDVAGMNECLNVYPDVVVRAICDLLSGKELHLGDGTAIRLKK